MCVNKGFFLVVRIIWKIFIFLRKINKLVFLVEIYSDVNNSIVYDDLHICVVCKRAARSASAMPTAERLRRAKARRGVQKLCQHKTESVASTSSGATMDLSRATEVLDSNSREAIAEIKLQRVRLSRYRSLQKNRLDNFKKYMNDNFYAHTLQTYCYFCERIWWSNKLRALKENSQAWNCVVKLGYDPKVLGFKVCGTCLNDLNHQRTPLLSTVNGFMYPEEANLPALCPIGERLVSPRLPFMSIRHVRFFEGSKKLHGQVINVPVEVDNMVSFT